MDSNLIMFKSKAGKITVIKDTTIKFKPNKPKKQNLERKKYLKEARKGVQWKVISNFIPKYLKNPI